MAAWNSVNTVYFIMQYGQHPCLWNTNHVEFKSRAARESAIDAIVLAMIRYRPNLNRSDVKLKIRSLRTKYTKMCDQMRQRIANEAYGGHQQRNVPDWFAAMDSFMHQSAVIDVPRRSTENENMPSIGREQPMRLRTIHYIPSSQSVCSASQRLRLDQEIAVINQIEHAVSSGMASLRAIAHQDYTSQQPYNEFMEFGRHIAMQLQGLPPSEVRMCQETILKVLHFHSTRNGVFQSALHVVASADNNQSINAEQHTNESQKCSPSSNIDEQCQRESIHSNHSPFDKDELNQVTNITQESQYTHGQREIININNSPINDREHRRIVDLNRVSYDVLHQFEPQYSRDNIDETQCQGEIISSNISSNDKENTRFDHMDHVTNDAISKLSDASPSSNYEISIVSQIDSPKQHQLCESSSSECIAKITYNENHDSSSMIENECLLDATRFTPELKNERDQMYSCHFESMYNQNPFNRKFDDDVVYTLSDSE